MSAPLHFYGRMDRRDQALNLNAAQEQKVIARLISTRDPGLYQRLYGIKHVNDAYAPPTRGVSGKNVVMPKN